MIHNKPYYFDFREESEDVYIVHVYDGGIISVEFEFGDEQAARNFHGALIDGNYKWAHEEVHGWEAITHPDLPPIDPNHALHLLGYK